MFAAKDGKAANRAKSMLYHYSGGTYNYHIEPEFPDFMKPKSFKTSRNPQDLLNELYNKVTVFPNPAEDYTTFMYDLRKDIKISVLQIFDSKGVMVLSTQLTGNIGSYLWDTRNIPSGSYIYAIFAGGKKLNGGKVIIQK